MSVIKHGITY